MFIVIIYHIRGIIYFSGIILQVLLLVGANGGIMTRTGLIITGGTGIGGTDIIGGIYTGIFRPGIIIHGGIELL